MYMSLLLVTLLGTAQAFAPAPIRWGGLSEQKLVLAHAPSSFLSEVPSQKLIVKDTHGKTLGNDIPHFVAKPDNTISWEAMNWCLEASGTNNGDAVRFNQCNGGQSQKWDWLAWGPIQLKGSNKCLDVVNKGGDLNGAPVELMDCDHIKLSEAWKFEEVETQSHFQFPGALQSVAAMAAFGLFGFTAWLWLSQQKAKRATLSGGIPLKSNDAGVPLSVPAVMAANVEYKGNSPWDNVPADDDAPLADDGPVLKGTPGEKGVPFVHMGFGGMGYGPQPKRPSTENKKKGDWTANSPWANVPADDDDAPLADDGPILKGTPGEKGVPYVHMGFGGMGYGPQPKRPSTENKKKGDWTANSPWANVPADDDDAPLADDGPVLKGTPGEKGVPFVHMSFGGMGP